MTRTPGHPDCACGEHALFPQTPWSLQWGVPLFVHTETRCGTADSFQIYVIDYAVIGRQRFAEIAWSDGGSKSFNCGAVSDA